MPLGTDVVIIRGVEDQARHGGHAILDDNALGAAWLAGVVATSAAAQAPAPLAVTFRTIRCSRGNGRSTTRDKAAAPSMPTSTRRKRGRSRAARRDSHCRARRRRAARSPGLAPNIAAAGRTSEQACRARPRRRARPPIDTARPWRESPRPAATTDRRDRHMSAVQPAADRRRRRGQRGQRRHGGRRALGRLTRRRVISLSWGYARAHAPPADAALRAALEAAAAHGRGGRGTLIVVAATNDAVDNCAGPTLDLAALDSVLAVGVADFRDRIGGAGYGPCMTSWPRPRPKARRRSAC